MFLDPDEHEFERKAAEVKDPKAGARKFNQLSAEQKEELRKFFDARNAARTRWWPDHTKFNQKTSYERFRYRTEAWRLRAKNLNQVRHAYWWLLHNCVIHPLIGVLPIKPIFDLHDWSSVRLSATHLEKPWPKPPAGFEWVDR
jgi:hypothetical protein